MISLTSVLKSAVSDQPNNISKIWEQFVINLATIRGSESS